VLLPFSILYRYFGYDPHIDIGEGEDRKKKRGNGR
jgi:hypothetical protein